MNFHRPISSFLAVVRIVAGWLMAAAVVTVAASAAQAQTAPPVDPRFGCDKRPDVPLADAGVPDNIEFFKARLWDYRCNGGYDRDIAKVLGDARAWVKARAQTVKNAAIVLDIDETSLLNWPRIYTDGYAYFPSLPNQGCISDKAGDQCTVPDWRNCVFKRVGDPCGDLDWQKSGSAVAIGPTLDLYKLARCIDQPAGCVKVEVFFVTGRRENEYKGEMASVWTLRNLELAGFVGVDRDHLKMRDPKSPGVVSDHKIAARREIEKNFTIIANVGDQKSDLVGDTDGDHAEVTFKVPNPFYFIP